MRKIFTLVVVGTGLLLASPAPDFAKDIKKIEKECKSKKDKTICYAVKRYKVFEKACRAGDKKSCGMLKDLIRMKKGMDKGDALEAQGFAWLLENGETSAGK